MSESWIIEQEYQAKHLASRVAELIEAGQIASIRLTVGKTRTSRQQAALEVWCAAVADLFNELGITREVRSPIFKNDGLECAWAQHTVKDDIWRTMQQALTQKQSTTDATTLEIAAIYEELVKAFASRHGITLPPWPIKQDKS